MRLLLFLISFFLFSFILIGQNSFKADYDLVNPIKSGSPIAPEDQLEIHKKFLVNAISSNNEQYQFYGYLFLVSDYMRGQDYVTANQMLLKADSTIAKTNNKKWIGHILSRKAVLALRLDNLDSVIDY